MNISYFKGMEHSIGEDAGPTSRKVVIFKTPLFAKRLYLL